jgi:hypothetical protein
MTKNFPSIMRYGNNHQVKMLVEAGRGFALCAAALLLTMGVSRAQNATQSLSLSAGWNSVWLEVEPRYAAGDTVLNDPAVPGDDETLVAGDSLVGQPKAPQDIFTNAAITTIVTPKPLAGLAEFFGNDPGSISTFNQAEWRQWLRIDPSGSNNLSRISGNRPYLVEVGAGTTAFSLPVTGEARFFRPSWTPDRYNLLGFGIKGTISFEDFFSPAAGAHPVGRIYSLAPNGNWAVVNPTDPILDGVAYWIFCNGPSKYMGPVAVDFDLAVTGALNFGGPADAVTVGALKLDLEELVFSNRGGTPATPSLDLITADTGSGDLSLSVVKPIPASLGYMLAPGAGVDTSPGVTASPASLGETIAAQSTAVLSLGAQRNWITGQVGRTNLYRLATGNPGVQFWLPISALNSSIQLPSDTLPETPAGNVAGLWVGEVIIDSVTSIVEDGAPTRPAAGSAPVRILLHSDASGSVSLLSQVTIMQTKTADPEVAPVPVLVVDRRRLPFFEGVKERNGKRVGLPLDAVAFDMPRDTSLAAQSENPVTPDSDDLIDMIVAESTSPSTNWSSGQAIYPDRASVDPAAIDSYLLFRSIRPPALKELYKLSLPLTGAIGAGKTVATSPGSLVVDSFHRSNPFRHAFHKKHARGPKITRELTIVFDSDQPIPDRLTGSFRELMRGAIKSNLELTGRLELRRVSAVDSLEGAQ